MGQTNTKMVEIMQFKKWLEHGPTFPIVGGKARIRNWLISLFPRSGRIYVEPFAGRGNVFFKAKKQLNFKEWHLNDVQGDFFNALINTDLENLPQSVPDKQTWDYWRTQAEKGDPRGLLLEPEITWGGRGWQGGPRISTKDASHPPYSRDRYVQRAQAAKEMLTGENIKISAISWENMPWSEYNGQDFVYLDPPYYNSARYYKGKVNHPVLLDHLISANFRWALSGYDSELYEEKLKSFKKVQMERNAEIKGSNIRGKSSVVECVWMNY